MRSKPVYAALELDASARRHLFLTQGPDGRRAACRAVAADPSASAAVLTFDGAESDMDDVLAEAGMDTAFYVAGSEVFVWRTTHRLRQAGVEGRRIQQELAGSAARRVYCVHCRTTSEEVTAALYCCTACGLTLTVRDHFSRPLSAYMGVSADADLGVSADAERQQA